MREFINGVFVPLLQRMTNAPNASESMQRAIGQVIGELMGYARTHAAAPAPELPPNATSLDGNWLDLALREMESLNSEGNNAICSVTEAHWKVHGIMNAWHQGSRDRFFFRGEHHSDWDLTSSAGRSGFSPNANAPLSVSPGEMGELRRFQARVQIDQQLSSEVFPDGRVLSLESADWWALMQHYNGGTRLIDITSSIFCALFLACADWDGAIDTGTDGAVYLFPHTGSWRAANPHPHMRGGQINGPEDQLYPTVGEYFSVHAYPNIVRYRESFQRNDRLLAQDGYFLWHPDFHQPLNVGQHFKFRVPATRKYDVLRELYSIGYTARRLIRGSRGENAHSCVCQTIGVPV